MYHQFLQLKPMQNLMVYAMEVVLIWDILLSLYLMQDKLKQARLYSREQNIIIVIIVHYNTL